MSKIALVTYELNQGGTNRVLCHLANGFADAGHAVNVAYCTTARAEFNLDGALSPSVGRQAFGDTDWSSRGFGQLMTFRKYCRWLKTERPDIVLATGNNISWFTALGVLIALPSARYYVKTTNPILRERDSRFINWVRRKVYGLIFHRATGVLTLSEAENEILKGQFPASASKFSRVYNAYLTEEFEAQAAPPRTAPTNRPIIVLGVGRLVDQKRFDRLLRAFAAIQPVNAVLHIAGDGKFRNELEALATERGIADKVRFLGYTNVPQAMAASDLFVLSSDYEGLPAVVVEALASNLPVISTDCFANARDLLTELPGCRVVERSDDALAEALGTWLAAPTWGAELKPYALPYSSQSSARSHLAAMSC